MPSRRVVRRDVVALTAESRRIACGVPGSLPHPSQEATVRQEPCTEHRVAREYVSLLREPCWRPRHPALKPVKRE